jgi:ubiquinone biosynthesis protein COQ4
VSGYRRGRRARWLTGEDDEALMHEPLEAARERLLIAEPAAYKRAQAELGEVMASYASGQKTAAA